MKISGSQLSTSVAAVSLAFWLNLASAHPYHHKIRPCQSDNVASQITCGDAARVAGCIAHTGADEAHLKGCLVHAGCTREQAQVEAGWASARCQGSEGGDSEGGGDVEEVVIELREVQIEKRDTTTTEESSSTSTSATTTSTSDATSTTATSSSESATTTASSTDSTSSATSTASSSSSSTASSTSSSTTSSTSSSSTSTSTSSSSSSSAAAFGAWSYTIAAVLGVYVAVCMGCICYRCCAERNARKKALKLADEKEALALVKK